MELHIGDKIVHTVHGPGIVRDIRLMPWEDVPCEYYVVEVPSVKMQIYLRAGETLDDHVRPALAAKELPAVVEILRAAPQPLPGSTSLRGLNVERRFRSNNLDELAMLVRDLNAFVHAKKAMRAGDAHFWRMALTRLCAEWALALDIPIEAARSEIDRTMNIGAGSPSGGSRYEIH